MNTFIKLGVIISCSTMTACTTTSSLGHFTAASTHNVRNLDYDIANHTKVRTEGEACIKTFLGLINLGEDENRQEIALNNAIRSGQGNGTDGDLLVNVLITETYTSLPGYRSNCIVVAGDLVRLQK